MKGKEKDKKTGFPDFLKYRSNNLTGKEKNSFERVLQKDPFAAEAEEGLSTVDPSILKQDKSELERRLKSTIRRGRNFVWYRMAASVAVLMVIATLLIILQKKRPEDTTSMSDKEKTIFEIRMPEALKDKIVLPPVAQNRDTTGETPVEFVAAAEDQVKAEDAQMEAIAPVAARSATKSQDMKTKKFDSGGDSLVRITMDSDLTNLDEVVVIGYGVRRSDEAAGAVEGKKISEKDDAFYSYTEAEPVGGKDAFNKYVEENIVRPGQQGTQKAVVVLSFVVKLDGKPSGIKVIRSPGKLFSDEAIRLIVEGPLWKPASENGTETEEEVRVRIVFK